ncbi:O-antigen ligase family protein [Deferribacteraceae bacterium V6Fe1]|nr:O-antigen ligase family protein [Deferribacteraceae bacterium V6Fe1]
MVEYFMYIFSLSHFISISATQIAFGILLLFFIKDIVKGNKNIFLDKIVILFILFIVWTTLSKFVNYENFSSVSKLIKKSFSWWHYLIFFVTWYLFKEKKLKVSNAFNFLMLGAFLSSCYAIYELIKKLTPRADGFFTHALTYGNTISLIIILVFVILITKSYTTKIELYSYVLLFILYYASLMLTLSRGPILFTTITLLIILAMKYRSKGILFSLFIVFLFASLISTNDTFKNRFNDFFNDSYNVSTTSFGTRIVLWKSSLEIIKDNPVFGIGNNIRKYFDKYIDVPVSSKAHSHNSYLTLAIYHGIPALVILMTILGTLLYRFYKSDDQFTKLAGIGVIVAYMLDGLTENNFGDTEVLMLFCFIVGALYSKSGKIKS